MGLQEIYGVAISAKNKVNELDNEVKFLRFVIANKVANGEEQLQSYYNDHYLKDPNKRF